MANRWFEGDRYVTDDGTIMKITSVSEDFLACGDSKDVAKVHTFGLDGRTSCFPGDCGHGHLAKRLTGTIQDAMESRA